MELLTSDRLMPNGRFKVILLKFELVTVLLDPEFGVSQLTCLTAEICVIVLSTRHLVILHYKQGQC